MFSSKTECLLLDKIEVLINQKTDNIVRSRRNFKKRKERKKRKNRPRLTCLQQKVYTILLRCKFPYRGIEKYTKNRRLEKQSVLVLTIGIGNTIGYQQLVDISHHLSSYDILPVSAHLRYGNQVSGSVGTEPRPPAGPP